MGRIVKYNQAKGDNGRTKSTTFNSSSGYATNDGATDSNQISCNLWGNDFDGKRDIDDSMSVNGDIYLKFDPDDFDDSEFTDDEGNVVDDLPSGSLYADGKVEARDSVYGKTIYLDYPEKIPDQVVENEDGDEERTQDDSNKTDLLDILKDHDTRISNNKTDIDSLKTRMGNAETEITNLWDAMPENVSDLPNDAGYITADDIPDIPEIDKNAPVILFSGIIHSNNNDGSLIFQPWVVRPLCYAQHTSVQEIKLSYLEVGGEKKCTLVVEVVAKEGWTVKPTSMHSSVSLNCHCNPAVDFGGNRRSQGYWTTGGVFPTGDLYIQVWRTLDDNNDSTINDQVAYSAQEMNITIFGLGYKN